MELRCASKLAPSFFFEGKLIRIHIGSWNVGSLTGKLRELVDVAIRSYHKTIDLRSYIT